MPNLYARRVRARVLEDAMLSERECADCLEDDAAISMEVRNRLGRIRKATDIALPRLVSAPLDNAPLEDGENCDNEPTGDEPAPAPANLTPTPNPLLTGEGARHEREGFPEWEAAEICQNEPAEAEGIIEVDPRTHPAFLGRNEVPVRCPTPPCTSAKTTASSTPPPAPSRIRQ